jgi:hypothetical protein
MNSNDFFLHRKTNLANVTYPFVVGDIKITGWAERTGTQQFIPNLPSLSGYVGDCSFKFQK